MERKFASKHGKNMKKEEIDIVLDDDNIIDESAKNCVLNATSSEVFTSTKYEKEMKNFESSDAYNVKLEQFEGPLDLLLFLIKEAKIDIKDIFISKITDEYLKYINSMENLSMEKMGEFIEIAATLIEIKSKKLLPKQEEEILDEESPEQKLIRQLEEYKIFKEASEELRVLDDPDKFYKAPEPNAGNFRYELKDMDFAGLLDAFTSLMHRVVLRAEVPATKKIEKERFTVAQKMSEIKDNIMLDGEVRFTSLFDKNYSKIEIINTFLALLELLKIQYIHARQDKLFDEIYITRNNETDINTDIKSEFE